MKIRDIVSIIEEYNNYMAAREILDSSMRYSTNEQREEARNRRIQRYNEWLNQEVEDVNTSDVDEATHAANMRILGLLKTYLDLNPCIRFGQALVNLSIIQTPSVDGHYVGDYAMDPYYDKSEDILERARGRIRNEQKR